MSTVLDPIEAFYALEAAVRAAAKPSLRDRMAELRARVSPRLPAREWAVLYREAAGLASELGGRDESKSEPKVALDAATRRFVEAALREAQLVPQAVSDEWTARLQRQRDGELLAPAKGELERLRLEVKRDGPRLSVVLSVEEAARWREWLSGWVRVWAEKVAEKVPASTADKVQSALEPAWARLPAELTAPAPPRTALAPYAVPAFSLGQLEDTVKIPTTFEIFFQSFRSAMFAVMGLAAVGASAAALLVGDKGHLRAAAPLLMVPVGALVYRQARVRAREFEAEREAELRKAVLAKVLQATKDHLDVVHSGLRAWLQRQTQASRENLQRYTNEVVFRLDALSDGARPGRPTGDASSNSAHGLEAALRARAATLESG
jgi:hypothetical protein